MPNRRSPRHHAGHRAPTAAVGPVVYRRRQFAAGAVLTAVAASALAGFLHDHGAARADRRIAARSSPVLMSSALSGPPSSTAAETSGASASAPSSSPTVSRSAAATGPTPVIEHGAGTFAPVTLAGTPITTGRPVTVGLQVERGLDSDNAAIARQVSSILLDPRGWQGVDHISFHLLTADQLAKGAVPDVLVTIAGPDTVDNLCAPLNTEGELSCGNAGRAVLNYKRWMDGISYYGKDLKGYRSYLVGHEVGHIIGHGHATCAAKGQPAPVMQQQTKGLQGCTPWPWPKRP